MEPCSIKLYWDVDLEPLNSLDSLIKRVEKERNKPLRTRTVLNVSSPEELEYGNKFAMFMRGLPVLMMKALPSSQVDRELFTKYGLCTDRSNKYPEHALRYFWCNPHFDGNSICNSRLRKFLELFSVDPDDFIFALHGPYESIPQLDGIADDDDIDWAAYAELLRSWGLDAEEILRTDDLSTEGSVSEETLRPVKYQYSLPSSIRSGLAGERTSLHVGYPVYLTRRYLSYAVKMKDLLVLLVQLTRAGRTMDLVSLENTDRVALRRLIKKIVHTVNPHARDIYGPNNWGTMASIREADGLRSMNHHQIRSLRTWDPLRRELSRLLRLIKP